MSLPNYHLFESDLKLSRAELGVEIIDNGRYEEFYQKGDRRGNGKNAEMQQYHKTRRLALEKLRNEKFGK